MFDTTALKEDFSRAADQYDAAAHLQRRVRTHGLNLAQGFWPAGTQLLDVGCGTGALSDDARHRGFAWNITGLDISEGMCRIARQRARAVFTADAEAMPFNDASFDGIFSSLMLQWANQPVRVWQEMARVIKPGKRAMVATLTRGTLKELAAAFSAVDESPHVSDFPATSQVLAEAAQAGWRVVSGETSTQIERYADAKALMQSLKTIGAANKRAERRKSLMTPFQLARLEREYRQRFAVAQGVMATWRVLYIVAERKG